MFNVSQIFLLVYKNVDDFFFLSLLNYNIIKVISNFYFVIYKQIIESYVMNQQIYDVFFEENIRFEPKEDFFQKNTYAMAYSPNKRT